MLENKNFGNINKNLSANFDITYRKIRDDIYLYCLVVMFVDEKISLHNNTYFRLCHVDELMKVLEHPLTFFKLKNNDLNGYRLFKPEIREALRQDCENGDNDKYMIPFENILWDEDDKFISSSIIAQMDHYYGIFKEYQNDIPFATSISFDYVKGHLDNDHYDLEKVVDILLKRKDITFDHIRGTKDTFIHEIPYYNATKYINHFIAFTWHPTDEDWKEYVKSPAFGDWNRYEYILKNIFKLPLKKA